MALTLINNLSSLIAQDNLNHSTQSLSTTLQQLSSGKKLNTGADGPAALVISEQQLAQIAGLNTAINNTNEGINVVQTGEGALSEVNTLLATARSLALDAANTGADDTNSLNADQAELTNIINTIQNIATTTQFGSTKLLNGDAGVAIGAPTGYTVSGTGSTQTGAYSLSALTNAVKANFTAAGVFDNTVPLPSASTLTINGVNVILNAGNTDNLTDTVNAINAVSAQSGVTAFAVSGGTKLELISNNYGSAGNFTASLSGSGLVSGEDLANTLGFATPAVNTATPTLGAVAGVDVSGTLEDANGNTYVGTGSGNTLNFNSGAVNGLSIAFGPAGSTANTTTVGAVNDLLTVTNNALTFQIGANFEQTASISFGNIQTTALGTGVTNTSGFTSLANISIANGGQNAQDALLVIDQAINQVSTLDGNLGAFQTNSLQANATNLQAELQNTTAANSTITDTDFAAATSNLATEQVLTQAGAAVLSSANQTTQLVLQLLQKLP